VSAHGRLARAGVEFLLIAVGTWLAFGEPRYEMETGNAMTAKMGIREGAASAVVFSVLLFALVSVDPRVRDHVSDFVGSSASVAPLSARFSELAGALWSAARYQSIENAPLLVFATVGAVLTVFMLRS
jgi:hypothetical protein